MHLKRVELENFKSFGRRLAVPFLDGFTAITGPNGSGKSNIGDAILFVLGPKSNKAIRAGKLTDLIFNGGKEKKPSDHCKVSLVFANEDRTIPVESDEVTLTRLVKLSKNSPENYYSYFYVNGKPSSLTEFDNLLAHSRISADGYNIVRQGDVLRIVDMTPLDRRRIVDDIAGVTKFDEDITKANAEKSIVEQNLDRIKIILAEIDAQLGTLEREREHALRYKTLKEELDLTKGKLARRRHDNLQSDLKGVHLSIVSAEEDRSKLENEHLKLKADLANVEEAIAKVESKIAERGGAEAAQLRVKIDELRAVTIRATERLNYAKGEMADLKKDRVSFEGDLKRVTKEEQKLQKVASDVQTKKADVDAVLAEREGELNGIRDALSKSTGRAGDLQRELAELKVQYEKTQASYGEARVEKGVLSDRDSRLKVQIAEVSEQIETVAFELKDADWELKELTKEASLTGEDLEKRKKALFDLKKKEAKVSQELRELEPAIRRLQNEYARLKAEQDASEAVSKGYNRAVDAVLSARDQGKLKGICGTIAELADVEGKFATAMEVAAGGRMQSIITETDADAAKAIEFLKSNRLGRATFLPLSKMVPGRPAGKPLMAVKDAESCGFAIDLVKFDERYRSAFWYVFRDTVVVKTMTAARKLMGGVRLVTLEGEIIDASGAMTGGDFVSKESKTKFGGVPKEALDKVAKDLRAAVVGQETLSDELVKVRAEIDGIDRELREGTSVTSTKTDRIGELQKKRAEFEKRSHDLHAERETLAKEQLKVQSQLAKEEKAASELESKIAALDASREEKSKLLLAATSKDFGDKMVKLSQAVEKLKEESRDFASQLETRQREIQLLAERRGEIETKVTEIDAKIAEHEKSAMESQEAMASKERELAVLLKVEAEASAELKGLHEERDRVIAKRSDLQQRATKLSDKVDAQGDVILQLKARVPAIEEALAEVAQELALFPNAPVEVAESLEELRARVRKLEGQLESLGNVNMLALDEYERQAARKTELSAEVAKAEAERETLMKVVEEISGKKKVEFFKVFDEINKNFQTVFGRLSDGGKAELILENAAEPFQGGLTMRAQPKGKKVTRLEALSGGEKSLTSMAFIFAIQEYDPSPFYYLDEVDQNLDGINAELLSRLVRVNSKSAQVIMVSLRKVTLKEADHVYGVTMLDSGLSEVVGEVRVSEIVEEPVPTVQGAAP